MGVPEQGGLTWWLFLFWCALNVSVGHRAFKNTATILISPGEVPVFAPELGAPEPFEGGFGVG